MNKKIWFSLMAVMIIASMLLSACAPATTPAPAPVTEAPAAAPAATEVPAMTQAPAAPTEAPAPAATEAPAATTAPAAAFKACQVTDTGGIDDKSFNATAWKGVTDAEKQFNITGKYLESTQQTDYEKNINALLDEKCDIIVTVGFLLGDATKAAAEKNPNVKFTIVDFAYDPTVPNILGQVFNTDEAAFLAGYLAAAVTKTGKVGTFGGMKIPTVTIFMDGFYQGVQYYNQQKGKTVEVLGWDPTKQTGLFTGNFESTDDGRTMALSLMDEGADIIMPVAGPVGLGTAAAIKERGNAYIIGVDSDWYLTAPDYKAIELTSVMKNMDVTTVSAIKSAMDGTFKGGVTVGTLSNGGVGLAPFHDLDSMVPADVKTELDAIKADVVAGKVATKPGAAPAAPTAAPTTAAVAATPPPPVCAKLPNPPTAKAGELGSPDKPIVITFVPSGDTGKITKAGTAIADCLSQMTGLSFKIEVGTTFAASIEAMGAEKAQIGFLNTFSVLLAEAKYQVVPVLATVRKYATNDVDPDKALKDQMEPFYKGEFIAKKDSGIKAFADLKGKTFCFVDPNSTSGYIIPRIVLKANGVDPDKDLKASQNAGSHNNVGIAVYKGDCDAGVAYIDVLTDVSANLKEKYPDIADKVGAFADTDRVPNDGVQVVKGMDPALQAAIVDGLMAMAQDPGGNAVLVSLYNIKGFQKIDATFYDDFTALLKKAGVDPTTLVK